MSVSSRTAPSRFSRFRNDFDCCRLSLPLPTKGSRLSCRDPAQLRGRPNSDEELVWCLQRFFTFGDFTHDCFNGGAPYKDFGVLVVSANVLVVRLDQLWNVFECGPANTFVGDLPEPTLHHIEPGTRRWNKVQMKPWVTF